MSASPDPAPLTFWSHFREFMAIFAPLAISLIAIAAMHYYAEYRAKQVTQGDSEILNVDLVRRTITSDIANVVSDLMFLAERSGQERYLDRTEKPRRNIAREYLIFARNKRIYDHIRFLNTDGRELVRINYAGGQSHVIPNRDLQDKSQRYYFRDALDTPQGEVYMSPLDLNIEAGEIERPLKPMIRFATPVFDRKGNKQGILFLNYLGDNLIQRFKRVAINISDRVQLVNSAGYWISSPDPAQEWGFMFNNNRTFSARYPEAWRKISNSDTGQFVTTRGMFTYSTVYPLQIAKLSAKQGINPDLVVQRGQLKPDLGGYYWKVISHVQPAALGASPVDFMRRNLLLYTTLLLLLGIISLYLAHSRLRHRQAVAQNEYEKRFRNTLEDIQLAAVTLDSRAKILFCNDFLLHLTGWQRGEILGCDWVELFVPESQRHEARKLMQSNMPAISQPEILTRSGNQLLISWNLTHSWNQEGSLTSVTAIGEDITERQRTQEDLRKLSRAVEQSPSVVMIVNRRGKIEYVNPKFCQITGYRPEEVIGKNPRILKSGETSQEEYRNLWNTLLSGGIWRGELHNRKKNGELFWEAAAISPVRDQTGKITHFLAVKEDITERKRLEQEVEKHNRELARTHALAVVGRMANMIAHDLRNPLSSIKMTLQILGKQRQEQQHENSRELCDIALAQVRYMEDMLADLLTYSRPDTLKPEWLTIERLLDTAIGLVQKKIDEYGVKLSTHYQSGLPTVCADATKLRQVFSNLIINAAQSTEQQPAAQRKVDIYTRFLLTEDGPHIRVEVHDSGIGIDPALHENLFEPFFTTRARGSGLGLAIVKRIIEQHHGSVRLQQRAAGGTCAVITLPTSAIQTGNGSAEPATGEADNIYPIDARKAKN